MKSNWSLTRKCTVPKGKRDYEGEIESAQKKVDQLKWLLSEAKKLKSSPILTNIKFRPEHTETHLSEEAIKEVILNSPYPDRGVLSTHVESGPSIE
jgi:hypothetical protein